MGETIKGCGVDIIEVERIAKALARPQFQQRIYTTREQEILRSRHVQSWAARFAAKEAVMKAIGCGWQYGVRFTDIEILPEPSGKPAVILSGQAQIIAAQMHISKVLVSMSHNRSVAIAYAVCVGED